MWLFSHDQLQGIPESNLLNQAKETTVLRYTSLHADHDVTLLRFTHFVHNNCYSIQLNQSDTILESLSANMFWVKLSGKYLRLGWTAQNQVFQNSKLNAIGKEKENVEDS